MKVGDVRRVKILGVLVLSTTVRKTSVDKAAGRGSGGDSDDEASLDELFAAGRAGDVDGNAVTSEFKASARLSGNGSCGVGDPTVTDARGPSLRTPSRAPYLCITPALPFSARPCGVLVLLVRRRWL